MLLFLIPTTVARIPVTLESDCLLSPGVQLIPNTQTIDTMLALSRRKPSLALRTSHLAPNAHLQIEWSGRPYPDEATGIVAIGDPAAVLAKLNYSMHWKGTPGSEPTASEFFIWVQRYLKNQVNDHLCQLEPMVNTLLERQAARERLM